MNVLTARFFVGSCFGVLLTVCPVYIAEVRDMLDSYMDGTLSLNKIQQQMCTIQKRPF